MRNLLFIYLSLILLSCQQSVQVDLIIHNAHIESVDESMGVYEAMAISGDTIVEIGPEHQILNKYAATQKIDAGKTFIYPGLIDAHSHFTGFAKNLNRLDLMGCQSEEEMQDRLLEFADKVTGDWILGRGWDQNLWEGQNYPNMNWLNEHLGDKYVFLQRVDGHAALVNQKTLDLAGIDVNTVIDGGKVLTENGKCTGILIDNAVDMVSKLIPDPTEEELLDLVKRAELKCFEKGLTGVCDAGVSNEVAHFYMNWSRNASIRIKAYVMLDPSNENFKEFLKSGPVREENLSISSFKFYADGALGSRGALLLEDYTDDPGNRGLKVTSDDTLRKYAPNIRDAGFQMNTHAIGDGANRDVLKIYAEFLGGTNDNRWRIEHAQVVHEDDLQFFRNYNILPSVQPTHATSDMEWADERLGQERIHRAYAFNSLMQQNGLIALGTDFPVEDIDPLKTFLAAVNRTDLNGNPEGGYYKEEGLSFEDCLRGLTIWAAITNFEEETKGSLEAGKKADFIRFNRDLRELNASNFNDYKVLSTYIDGEEVYTTAD